jgi:hypothetical protein
MRRLGTVACLKSIIISDQAVINVGIWRKKEGKTLFKQCGMTTIKIQLNTSSSTFSKYIDAILGLIIKASIPSIARRHFKVLGDATNQFSTLLRFLHNTTIRDQQTPLPLLFFPPLLSVKVLAGKQSH